MRILTFDVETTGLPKRRGASLYDTAQFPYVVQLSWLVYNTGTNIVEKVSDYIVRLPAGVLVPPRAAAIHGITNDRMLAEGDPIQPVLSEFMLDVSRCTFLVAHNLEFDKTIVEVELIRNKFAKRLSRYRKMEYCTMRNSIKLCGLKMWSNYKSKYVPKYPKLMELHEKLFGTIPENLHNSLVDILVCFRCFHKLVYDVDIMDINRKYRNNFEKLCGSTEKKAPTSVDLPPENDPPQRPCSPPDI